MNKKSNLQEASECLTAALINLNDARIKLASLSHQALTDVDKAVSKANLALKRVDAGLKVKHETSPK